MRPVPEDIRKKYDRALQLLVGRIANLIDEGKTDKEICESCHNQFEHFVAVTREVNQYRTHK